MAGWEGARGRRYGAEDRGLWALGAVVTSMIRQCMGQSGTLTTGGALQTGEVCQSPWTKYFVSVYSHSRDELNPVKRSG